MSSYAARVVRCRAILFDLDGVLVDSTANVERHWTVWARRHDLDPEKLLPIVHGRRAIDTIRVVTPWLDAERELADLIEMEAQDTEGVVAMPGAARLLAQLDGARWAVVTSGAREVATARLRAAELPLPPVFVTADQIQNGKPDPEGYLTAARRLDTPPSQCAVVEDAPAGAEAARASGAHLVTLATTHSLDALGDADLALQSLSDLQLTIAADRSLVMQAAATPP
jgi:mannitol-1-/sugar-/sorbitol-6-phosphatase